MGGSFTHLHVHTEYSLLDGANRIKEIFPYIKSLGMDSIAITDHGVMFGVIDFYNEALKNGVKPIIGCEAYVAPTNRFDRTRGKDEAYGHIVLLAKNNAGYKDLIKLVSAGFLEGFYYKPRIDYDLLSRHCGNLIGMSACLSGDIPALIIKNDYEKARDMALRLDGMFGRGNFYLEIQKNGIEIQNMVNQQLIRISSETGIPLVATNDAHYTRKEDSKTHEILLCIQTASNINDEKRMKFESDELYLKSPEEMETAFAAIPQAIENTLRIADMCNVTFEFGKPIIPEYKTPGTDKFKFLTDLCTEGMKRRYGENPTKEVKERLSYELSVIRDMDYIDYFLIVWDFIRFARNAGIMVGPGRGSGAGSIVSYCIGITGIDPLKYGLLFERFLNPERISMPDFDIDFCYERRQEVIDYVINKYSRDNVAQIVTFGTMAARAVIRDVGRALDIPYADVDRAAKMIPMSIGVTIDKALEDNSEFRALCAENPAMNELITYAKKLEGMPRHSSMHAAGVVITKEPVTEYVPLLMSDDVIMTQYPMDTLELLGLLKMDFLSLRTLTVIRDTVEMAQKNHNTLIDMDILPFNDANIYKMLGEGKTSGVFQLESGGMTLFIKELKPKCLEDIIAGVALFRPGPMEQIPRYIRFRNDPKKISYLHPVLEKILDVTFGCIIYQEQVMQIVRDVAGYSLGRADLVRRAMSKKKYEVMMEERKNFVHGLDDKDGKIIIKGAVRNGVDEATANAIFDEMLNFANYAFNKSHAAAYAILAYQTAWLKYYYSVEFMAAMMNSLIGNHGKIAQYVQECKNLGIVVLPPDINESTVKFNVVNGKIRFGLIALKNTGQNAASAAISERYAGGPYKGLKDFIDRVDSSFVNKRCIESLIQCGAFDSFGVYRTRLLAVYEKMMDSASDAKRHNIRGQISLFENGSKIPQQSGADGFPELEEFSKRRLLEMEKDILGLYVSGHPLDELRDVIAARVSHTGGDFAKSDDDEAPVEMSDNMNVVIGGVIVSKQTKTTKNGSVMAFATVEDFFGQIEVIFFPKTYEKYSALIQTDNPVFIRGRVSLKEEEEAKVICEDVELIIRKESPELRMTFPEGMSNSECRSVLSLLVYFRGNVPVYARRDGAHEYRKLDKNYWVDMNSYLYKELSERLGEKNVIMSSKS